MDFDIQEEVDYVLDRRNLLELRAIRLFVLMVALHSARSIATVVGDKISDEENSLILKADKKIIRTAQMLAAMKFLAGIESTYGKQAPGIRTLLKRASFARIYDQMIAANGGWYRLRYVRDLARFEADIETLRRHAKDIAKIVEFSMRYVPDPKKSRKLGGITMALDILPSKESSLKTRLQKTQLHPVWTARKSAAPFLYLLYRQKYAFYLKGIKSKAFNSVWLKRAEDHDQLLEFFSAYNVVVERLRDRYRYTALQLPKNAKLPQLPIDPFSKAKDANIFYAL